MNASDIGQVIKGASSQTANLTEWQNSSGTVLGSIGADGKLSLNITAGARESIANFTVSDAGKDKFFFYNSTNGASRFQPSFGGYTDSAAIASLSFVGFTSAARDTSTSEPALIYFNAVRSSSATDPANGTLTAIANRPLYAFGSYPGVGNVTYMQMSALGLIGIGNDLQASAQLHIQSSTTSTITQKIQAIASQTANLTEWQNSSGTVLAYVEKAGLVKSSGRKQAVRVVSTDTTLTLNDEVVVFTASATATLPQALGTGQVYSIAPESNSGAIVVVEGNSTDTIDGELNQTLDDTMAIDVKDYAIGKWIII
jgi:hypothetical protein